MGKVGTETHDECVAKGGLHCEGSIDALGAVLTGMFGGFVSDAGVADQVRLASRSLFIPSEDDVSPPGASVKRDQAPFWMAAMSSYAILDRLISPFIVE